MTGDVDHLSYTKVFKKRVRWLMKFALKNKERVKAAPKVVGQCPCCGSNLIAKCGSQKAWHWSHKGKRHCDHWWENETEWHRNWKDHFSSEWQEIVHLADDGEKHIADVKTPDGLVIEFQHSAMTMDEKNAWHTGWLVEFTVFTLYLFIMLIYSWVTGISEGALEQAREGPSCIDA